MADLLLEIKEAVEKLKRTGTVSARKISKTSSEGAVK